jgi:hypothetical protein
MRQVSKNAGVEIEGGCITGKLAFEFEITKRMTLRLTGGKPLHT